MPSQLKVQVGAITYTPPYWPELLVSNIAKGNHAGRLPSDVGAHACWYYFLLAHKAHKEARENLVYEDELSKHFDVFAARRLLESIAQMYNLQAREVVRYWDAVEAQRLALGFSLNADLPAVLKFRFN